jgi:EpsD family peptidyl-prolyl cis-trans isomerase
MQGRKLLGAALVLVAVGACHRPSILGGKPPAPTGQVVATIGNQEITLRQLQAELANVAITDPQQLKTAEQRALQLIITRTLMANAARGQGLDKNPDFALQRQRAIDAILADDLQAKVAASVPAPSQDEIQRFVSNNPDMFAQRKVWDVDQIRLAIPDNPNVLRPLAPLNTLQDVQAYLSSQHIDFNRSDSTVDAASLDPAVVAQIVKLPADTVFVIPAGRYVLVNQIKDTRVVPMKTDLTSKYAAQLLRSQHVQAAVRQEMQTVVGDGMKTVQYSPAFRPAPDTQQASAPAATPASNAAGGQPR